MQSTHSAAVVTAPNYLSMSIHELDAFVVAHRDDLGAPGLEIGDLASAIHSGKALAVRKEYGFALVEPAGPLLWLLWIDPSVRGQKRGHKFVRELLREFSKERHMRLYCEGPDRRRFFGRLGFRVESRDAEMRSMTTNDWRG